MIRTQIKFLMAATFAAALFFAAPMRARGDSSSPKDSAALTAAEFGAQMQRLESELKAKHPSPGELAAIRAGIPKAWEVETSEGRYSISSAPLTAILRQAEKDSTERADKLDNARAWLADIREQVEGYDAGASADDATARGKLSEILRQREFAGVGPPGVQDRLRKMINRWLVRFFTWLFGGLNRHPVATKVFFWLLVGACVAWLAFMLFRFWSRGAKLETMQKIEATKFDRPWQEWIRAAREAAARGDFREAIHSTYWAAIVRLQSGGALTPDESRTPRESLRLLDDAAASGVYATVRQRESLSRLTASLERVWYGQRAAAAADFEESLRQAEELGCRVS